MIVHYVDQVKLPSCWNNVVYRSARQMSISICLLASTQMVAVDALTAL